MSNFEDHLWSQLVRERSGQMRVASKAAASLASSVTATSSAGPGGSRVRRPAVLTGAGLGLAGLATAGVLVLSAGSAAPAFAVTKDAGGTVAITLSDLSALPALNQKLTQEGIRVVAVPMSATCTTTGSFAILPGVPLGTEPTSAAVLIDPRDIPTGDVGVVGVIQTDSGRWGLVTVEAPAPGPSCLNVAAYNSSTLHGGSASAAQARKMRHEETRLSRGSGRHTRQQGTTR
jgi:hypothetical protein